MSSIVKAKYNKVQVLAPINSVTSNLAFCTADVEYITDEATNYKMLAYVQQGLTITQALVGDLGSATVIYLSSSKAKLEQYLPIKIIIVSIRSVEDNGTVTNYIDSTTELDYLVAKDVTQELSPLNSDFKYQHTLTLIEPTVYLEKFVLPAHANTRKYSDSGSAATIKDQVLDELNLAMGPIPYRSSIIQQIFSLSSVLATKLDALPAEEFFYESPPLLREVLDDMFRLANIRAKIESISDFESITIGYHDYETTTSTVSLPNNINVNMVTPAFDQLSKHLEVHGKNAISSNKIVCSTGWDTFKPTDGSSVLTTNNTGISTSHPIETVTSFKLNLTFKMTQDLLISLTNNLALTFGKAIDTVVNFFKNVFGDTTNSTSEAIVQNWVSNNLQITLGTEYEIPELDLTDYLYDIEEYNKLSSSDKLKALCYERGSNTVSVGSYTTVVFFPLATMAYVIRDAIANQCASDIANTSTIVYRVYTALVSFINQYSTWFEGLIDSITTLGGLLESGNTGGIFDLTKMIYKLEYIPYIDAHARFSKDNALSSLPETTQLDNQGEQSIDVNRYGKAEKNKINILGNSTHNISALANYYSDLLSVGTVIYGGRLTITGRECSIYNNFVEVAYELDADYQVNQQRVTIDRAKRIYDIPLSGASITKAILFKRYIQVSDDELVTDTGVLNYTALSRIYYYLLQNPTYGIGPIKFALMSFVDGYNGGNISVNGSTVLEHDQISNYRYQLLVARYIMATSMCFSVKQYDNYSVGYGVGTRVIGGKRVLLNRYVNKYSGRYKSIFLQLTGQRTDTYTTRTDKITALNKLPLITDGMSYVAMCDRVKHNYAKDAFDSDQYTIQYEFVSNKNYIFIKSKLAEYNGLMQDHLVVMRFYYSNSESYTKDDTKAKGSYCSTSDRVDVYSPTSGERYLRVTMLAGNISWAIANSDGDILLAYNKPSTVSSSVISIYMAGSLERQYTVSHQNEGYTLTYYVDGLNALDPLIFVGVTSNIPDPNVLTGQNTIVALPTINFSLSSGYTWNGWYYGYYLNGSLIRTSVAANEGDVLSDDTILVPYYTGNVIEI